MLDADVCDFSDVQHIIPVCISPAVAATILEDAETVDVHKMLYLKCLSIPIADIARPLKHTSE